MAISNSYVSHNQGVSLSQQSCSWDQPGCGIPEALLFRPPYDGDGGGRPGRPKNEPYPIPPKNKEVNNNSQLEDWRFMIGFFHIIKKKCPEHLRQFPLKQKGYVSFQAYCIDLVINVVLSQECEPTRRGLTTLDTSTVGLIKCCQFVTRGLFL